MSQKQLSLISFVIGFGFGIVLSGTLLFLFGFYFLNSIRTESWEEQGGFVRSIGEEFRIRAETEASAALHGTLEYIDASSIRVRSGEETITFRHDASTQFFELLNDDVSTEAPISLGEIVVGDRVTVLRAESTDRTEPLAAKVIRF